jgi:hypothetical protein
VHDRFHDEIRFRRRRLTATSAQSKMARPSIEAPTPLPGFPPASCSILHKGRPFEAAGIRLQRREGRGRLAGLFHRAGYLWTSPPFAPPFPPCVVAPEPFWLCDWPPRNSPLPAPAAPPACTAEPPRIDRTATSAAKAEIFIVVSLMGARPAH